jgi:hypothetical protein
MHASPVEAVLLKISEVVWLFALSNACVTSGSVFGDDFGGRRGYLRCRIHASPVEAVSMNIYEAEGLFALSNPCVTPGSTFVDDLGGPMGCLLCLIHASPVEAVSLMISDSAVTEFLLMISKPTWALCAVESMRHPWK